MNQRWVVALLTLSLAVFSSCAVAATGPESVRDLIIIGLEENIGLRVEQLNIPLRAATVVIDESVFDPEFFASVGYLKTRTPLTSYLSLAAPSNSQQLTGQLGLRKRYSSGLTASLSLDTDWGEDNNPTEDLDPRYHSAFNLTLTQPLLRDFGAKVNRSSVQLSRNQYQQAELQHLLQAQRLALQIEVLAGQLAGEAEIVQLRTEAVALSEELYAANQRRFDAGIIPVSEVQEAETALADRELGRSLAQQARELHFAQLNRQLNHRLPGDFNPLSLYALDSGDLQLQLPEFEQLFVAACELSVDLRLAEIAIKSSNIQQDFYRNQLRPRLDLQLQAGLNGLSGNGRSSAVNSRYAGSWGDSFVGAATGDGYQWGGGLEFSMPLGNRLARSRLQQAELQRKQANYRQQDIKSELRSQLEQQLTNLRRAFEQVKIAERFEHLAELSLQQEQRRLEEGLSDTFRILSFQDKMISAKIGRINALILYYSSVAELNFTRGNILEQHGITLQKRGEIP
ncbi:MAG: TolC family protein [Deltaproteobacteria bacterium]|nr:TolC family protein [Deltaproteobacteria bacterium]